MKIGKMLWRYVFLYWKLLIIVVLLFVVVVGVELIGLFIGKKMIDDYIFGIEKIWYEVVEKDKNVVKFYGIFYVREDCIQGFVF